MSNTRTLSQYMTPAWFAELVIERYFSRLSGHDHVLEPSCGTGSFLLALPDTVPATGVELDPALAAIARESTGRRVITGDFRTASLDVQPTAIIGNPPFKVDVIERFLLRAHELLPAGGQAGFILPAYTFQTAATVMRLAGRWSITQEAMPRNVFPRISVPLLFALFTKDERRTLVGFALYQEAYDALRLQQQYREAISAGPGIWRRLCQLALRRLGGEAPLPEIYAELQGRHPGAGQFWREKVRQTLRHYADTFAVVRDGRYRLREAA